MNAVFRVELAPLDPITPAFLVAPMTRAPAGGAVFGILAVVYSCLSRRRVFDMGAPKASILDILTFTPYTTLVIVLQHLIAVDGVLEVVGKIGPERNSVLSMVYAESATGRYPCVSPG